MAVTLADVLAEPSLALRLVHRPDPQRLDVAVRWVAVTELADPRPFLDGAELVLTTGLRMLDPGDQREFVARLAEAGVAGLGVGTGLTHAAVPGPIRDAAADLDLPLLEVPYRTPFIAVDRFVADRVLEEQYGRFRDLLAMHDRLSRAVLSGRGLTALVEELHGLVGGPVGVLDHLGGVLASAPDSAGWPVEVVLAEGRAGRGRPQAPPPGPAGTGLTVRPVEVDGTVLAHLCLRRLRRAADVIPYAVALVGLELAREQAVLAGRRELLGQVLEDLVRGSVAPADVHRRLGGFGVDPDAGHAVLLGSVDRAGADPTLRTRLRSMRWAAAPLPAPARPGGSGAGGAEPVLSALVGADLAVIAPAGRPVDDLAGRLLSHLEWVGPGARVGVGGVYAGVGGLRWSYLEAREALARGPGVNEREALSLTGLLLASQELPLREIAADLLRPVTEFDAAHGADLTATLRAYLEADGSVGEVAARLFVHRNTVRYRLGQIEGLTGRSLSSTQDRVHLWLALHAMAVSQPGLGAASGDVGQ